jgi:hypothetical protein
MRACPNCGRDIEDDSVFCGFCDAKLPPLPEAESGAEAVAAVPVADAAPARPAERCEKCGEPLEPGFSACWKCGAQKTSGAPGEAASAAALPLITVWGRGKRLDVYPDKLLIAATGDGAEHDFEIPIKSIISIEFTSAKGAAAGCMTVNCTAAPSGDRLAAVNVSEPVFFEARANQEMAKALELIKRCSAELDAQAG